MLTFRSTLRYALGALTAGAVICAVGLFSASAQDAKKSEKPEISEGIEGRVKSVDPDKETLTIVLSTGKERTFKVTEDTTMIGPRGGKVRRRLKDKRFREGMELTVVADGASASEIHLGFSRRDAGDSADSKPAPKRSASNPRDERENPATETAKAKVPAKIGTLAKAAAAKAAAVDEGDEEDDEIPGKVKSFDAARRILVVALLNGKSRSFFLARDTKVVVKGTTSKQGLKDAALKDGAVISVLVEAGGRRVKELRVNPPPAQKSKTAA
jgi:hypothetical protein